ncbi:hypothetical protein [Marivirga sp.]|uniref:hypothetical protein n=1 Tax=Marivirga sp. TaxID=2018662 RepID=UPI002D7FFE4A|nr:hypothetical protein [Marivirga sp.]HET8858614.1 hypothetical protein [Marivirga sp.]
MKNLSIERMDQVNGGAECETNAGVALGLGGALLIGGLTAATGGLGLIVAGGIGLYFGTAGSLICAMQ